MALPKPASTYHNFWLATRNYESPNRFGYDWFIAAIDQVWNSRTISVDWLDMESMQRDIIKSERLTSDQKVQLIAESIAAYTKRGNPMEY